MSMPNGTFHRYVTMAVLLYAVFCALRLYGVGWWSSPAVFDEHMYRMLVIALLLGIGVQLEEMCEKL